MDKSLRIGGCNGKLSNRQRFISLSFCVFSNFRKRGYCFTRSFCNRLFSGWKGNYQRIQAGAKNKFTESLIFLFLVQHCGIDYINFLRREINMQNDNMYEEHESTTTSRLSNVSFLIFGSTMICIIFACLGAFNHFLLRGYAIPGIPLEYQHKGAGYNHGFDTTDCIPDSVECAPSDKSDLWDAGQKVQKTTSVNPLEVLAALIVISVVLWVLASLLVSLTRARNKIEGKEQVSEYTIKGGERRAKANAMAIPLMISIAVIVWIVYQHAVGGSVQIFPGVWFSF